MVGTHQDHRNRRRHNKDNTADSGKYLIPRSNFISKGCASRDIEQHPTFAAPSTKTNSGKHHEEEPDEDND